MAAAAKFSNSNLDKSSFEAVSLALDNLSIYKQEKAATDIRIKISRVILKYLLIFILRALEQQISTCIIPYYRILESIKKRYFAAT